MDIVNAFEEVFKVADGLNNFELYTKLSELRIRMIEFEDENRTLKEQLRLANNRIGGEVRYSSAPNLR